MADRIICTTFPRSGHNMLANALQEMIGWEEFRYCEIYHHCQTLPCPDSRTNFQKTHDLDLQDPILPDRKYIVQYRHPYESITSWYSFFTNSANKEPSKDGWDIFFKQKLSFWKEFMNKWALGNQDPDRFLFIEYQNLLADPATQVSQIIEFMGHEHFPVQFDRLRNWKKKRNLIGFPFYSEAELKFAEQSCKQILEATGIQSLLGHPGLEGLPADFIDNLQSEYRAKTGGSPPLSRVLVSDSLARLGKSSIQPDKAGVLHFAAQILLELVYERQARIARLLGRVRNLENEIQRLWAQIKEKSAETSEVTDKLDHSSQDIESLKRLLARKETSLRNIKRSYSWRVTWPLRKLASYFLTFKRSRSR